MRRTVQVTVELLSIAAVLAVLAALAVGLLAVIRAEGLRGFLQRAAAQEIANFVGRPVRLGPVTGDLWSGMTIEGFSIAGTDGKPELAVEQLHADWNLPALVKRTADPAKAIRRLCVTRPYLRLYRDEQGITNVERLIYLIQQRLGAPRERKPLGEMGFVVEVTEGTVDYDLRGPGLPGGPQRGRISGLTGTLDPRRPELWQLALKLSTDGQYLDDVTLLAGFSIPTGQVGAQVAVRGARLARLSDLFLRGHGAQLGSGFADVSASLWVPSAGAPARWMVSAAAEDVSVSIREVPGAIGVPRASLAASPEGVFVSAARAHWRSTSTAVEAMVWDFKAPALVVRLDHLRLHVPDALALLPAEVVRDLPVTPEVQWLTGTAELTGPANHLDCTLSVVSEAPLAVTYKETTVRASSLSVEGALHDLTRPVAAGLVELTDVEVEGLPELELPSGERAQPAVSLVPKLSARVAWGNETAVAETSVALAEVTGLPVPVRDVTAAVSVAGDVVSLRDLELRTGEATVSGEAVAALAQEKNRGQGVLSFSELDLAALQPLLPEDFDHEVRGTAQGTALVALEGTEASVHGQVTVAEPALDEQSLTAASAEVVWEDEHLQVPWALAQAPEGRVVLEGEMAGKDVRARFCAADVDVAALSSRFSTQGPVGRAWATGTVTGTYEDPLAEVEVAAYGAGYEDYTVQALYLTGRGNKQEADVSQLLAYRDGAVLSLSGHASKLSAQAPYGNFRGQFRVLGVSIPQALAWAEYEGDIRPPGYAQLTGYISGTLAEPAVEARLHVVGVEHDIYRLEELQGPVRYVGDHVSFGPAHGRLQGVPLTAWAEVNGVVSDPSHAVTRAGLDTGAIELSRLVVLQRYGIGLGGEARVREAVVELHGSQLVQATADLSCSALRFGDEEIAPFDARVRTEEKLVKLQPVSVGLAGGDVLLSGEYDTDSRDVVAEAHLTDCRLPALLRLAQEAAPALVASQGEEGDPDALARPYAGLALRTRGVLSGTIGASGPVDELALVADVEGTGLALDGRRLPETSLACRYLPDERRVEDLEVEAQYGQGLIIVEGWAVLDDELYLVADASNLDVHSLSEWWPAPLSAAGSLQFTSVISGAVEAPLINGSLDVTDLTVEGLQFDLVSLPFVTVAEGGLDVDGLILKRGPHEMKAQGHLPFTWEKPGVPTDQPLLFTASFENGDLETFRTFAEEYYNAHFPDSPENPWASVQTAGRLDASVRVAGTLAEPTLAGAVGVTEGAVKMAGWATPVEGISLEVSMAPMPEGGSQVDLGDMRARYGQTELWGAGTVLLTQMAFEKLLENQWDVALGAKGPELSFVGGNTAEDLAVEARFESTRPGEARLSLAEGKAKLGTGEAVLEGGCTLTSLDWSQLHRNQFDVALALKDARVKYGGVFNGLLSGRLAVKNPSEGEPARVGGEVSVAHAVVGFQPGGGAAAPELRAAPVEAPAFTFDLRGAIAEDVKVRGAGINVPIQPDWNAFRLTGTPQDPNLKGLVTAQQGRASLPGGFLAIKTFSVDLRVAPAVGGAAPPKPLELLAVVEGQAERVVSQVEVDGRVFGPVHLYLNFAGELPGTIEVKATSEPALAEEQIYAILGAEPFGGLMAAGEAGSQALSQRFASLLAVGLRAGVFEPLEAQLRELLGLAEFGINFALDQPIEVQVGKYLVRDLLVSYRQGFGAGGENEWWLAVSYEVAPGAVVSYHARDDGEERFSVGYRRVF